MSTAFTAANTTAVAPTLSAIESSAVAVTAGARRRSRMAKRMSRNVDTTRLDTAMFDTMMLLQMSQSQGYIPSDHGVRLFFQQEGDGPAAVIIPHALFLHDDFRRLAKTRTLIFLDWRNRGR